MKVFHSNTHRLHDVPMEFNRGEMVPAFERPSRADNVLASLQAAKLGPLEAPKEFPLEHAYAVHDRALVDFLAGAYDEWRAMGRTGVIQPIAAPIRNLRNDRVPEALDGRVSYYCFDNTTGMTAGTWAAAKGSFDIAHERGGLRGLRAGDTMPSACADRRGIMRPAPSTVAIAS